jgi:C4-type Zn-finger protein
MGRFADFRDVISGLKHKKRDKTIVQLCPKCGSPKISLNRGSDVYPQMYGITPRMYVCQECGYRGPIVLEETKEENEDTLLG